MARDTVQILVNLIKKGTGAQEAEKELTGLEKATRVAGVALATFATKETVRAVYELGKLGAQSLRTERSFEAISGGATEAEKRLEAMRRATRGAISEQAMMSAANRMMQMGLANNSQELETMAGMAVRLGSAMGKDAAGSIEEWNLLIANQSIPRLDTFGVSAARVRTRIKQLQAATKDMTREEAFMIAVMEEGETSLARLGETVDDEMLAFEQMEANIANLKAAFAEQLAPAVAEVTGLMVDGLEEINKQIRAIDEYEAALGREAVASAYVAAHYQGKINALQDLELMTERVRAASELSTGQMSDYAEMGGRAVGVTGDLAEISGIAAGAQYDLAASAGKVSGMFGELEFDDETLWNMARASGAGVEALGALAQRLGIASEAQVQASLRTQELIEMYGDGQITSEELALKFAEVGREEHAAELAAVNTAREQANLGGVVDETTRKSDILAESMIGVTEETGNVGEEALYTRDDMGQLQEGLVGTHDAFDETVKRASRLREALARLRAMAQRTKSALDNVNDAMGDGGDRGRQVGGIAAGGMTLYGEGGPELGFLPRGTRVVPAWESRQVLRSMADNRRYNYSYGPIVVNDSLAAAMLIEDRKRELERSLRANM